MGVRFIIGRAGTGKSRRAFDSIVKAMRDEPLGPPIYWILPRQATFIAERQLTCASGLRGFCRARVLSFDHLGVEVLNECGGSAIPLINSLGRQMVLGHLLRRHQPQLKFFSTAARQAGLASELDEIFAELERCGKDADELQRLLTELQAADPDALLTQALHAKFHDLHLLYDAYCKFLGQERLDPHRRLQHVLTCIEHCRSLQGAAVYVDEFVEFTEYERRMLASIAKVAASVEVSLLMDPKSSQLDKPDQNPHELSLFHRTEETYRRLYVAFRDAAVTIEKPEKLEKVYRFENKSLALIEKVMFHPKPGKATACEGIELIEAPDRRSEVDAAARCIRRWLDDGLRLRDIAVLARDVDAYHELIDASFREHELPWFVDRRRSAVHHPLLQFVRAAVQLASASWPNDAMMALLKSGLAGVSLDQADELENYVLLHRIHGGAWAADEDWTYTRDLTRRTDEEGDDTELTPPQRSELRRVNAIRRRVTTPLRAFVKRIVGNKSLTVRDIVLALFDLIEQFKVRQRLHRWMAAADNAGQFEQRSEHEQVWAELVELLDQLVDLLGDEPVTLADFATILDSGLEQFDLALTPQTVDQVLVGGADRTRTGHVKAVVLLGMNEGEFPRVPRDGALLSDGERKVLDQKHKVKMERDGERRLLDENLLGYAAFTRATRKLCLTRPIADEAARPQAPSIFWRKLVSIFPMAPVERIGRDERDAPQHIGTPRQLVTSLMRWVRDHDGKSPSASEAPWPALYQWLATHSLLQDPVGEMRYRAWRALRYENHAALSPDIANQLFPQELHGSVSQIETFATCPFKHFARYGLRLREREDDDVTVMDLGNVYHGILEKIVRELVKARKNWPEMSPQEMDAAIRTYAREVGQSLRGELMLSSARNKYLLQRIEKTLEQVIAAQEAAARRGAFKPIAAELGFGINRAKLPAYEFKTPAGHTVKLYGKIDRVDLIEKQAAVAVIDYKLKGNSLALERVYYGIALQLLTYLLVLQANGEKLAGKKLTPAAAFYVRLLRQLEPVDHPDEATSPDDPAFNLQTKPRGIFDGRFLPGLDAEFAGGQSQVVAAYVKKDGAFGLKDKTDVAERDEFAALLRHVQRRLGELADQIIGGRIDVTPFRIRTATPCSHCEYRSVCRFETMSNRYAILESMSREQVLQRVVEEASDAR